MSLRFSVSTALALALIVGFGVGRLVETLEADVPGVPPWLLVGARLGILVLTIAVTLWVLSRGLAPLRRVAETAEEIIASGDVSKRVEGATGSDEVGRIAASFNQVVAKLESILLTQRRLLADTSHELRNPLTVIRTNVDMLGKPLDEETRREVTDETEREIRRVITLVEDLTLLSKTENTRPVRMEPVRLEAVVGEAVERLRPLAAGRALEMITPGASPVVLGDEDRLLQIMVNLIGNAIRYTSPTGSIVITVERRKDMGVVTVRDDGIGISPEHLPHVFERFYRADAARARNTGGSGLGLAIVKALVESHHGKVEVQSEVAKGSVFTVSIPTEDAERPRITHLMPVLAE